MPENEDQSSRSGGIWETVSEKLRSQGLDLDALCGGVLDDPRFRVVCCAPDLADSVQEMGRAPRGQTVMVRLDEETVSTLDAWVATEYFKSRSEAAALFIREGLKLRASELEQLKEALQQVEAAREKLRNKARSVFGERSASHDTGSAAAEEQSPG